MATDELSIKLLINKKTEKLCFAEAGSDVVEFLTGLLTKEGMVGSVGTLLGNAEKMGANYNTEEAELHLSPVVAPATFSRLQQLLGVQINGNGQLFTCSGKVGCNNCGHLSAIRYSRCPGCGCYRQKAMTLAGAVTDGPATATKLQTPSYTMKDDLSVTPASLSLIALLAQCGVSDLSVLQEKIVKIGKEESKTVLTDVFMPKKNARGKREAPEEVMPEKNARCKTEPPEDVILI